MMKMLMGLEHLTLGREGKSWGCSTWARESSVRDLTLMYKYSNGEEMSKEDSSH